MNDLWRKAVDDLLKCFQKPQREIKEGWLLASALLMQVRVRDWDEDQLKQQFRAFLWAELEQRRRDVGVKVTAEHSAQERLQHDVAAADVLLEELSFVWATFADNLAMQHIQRIVPHASRTVQDRILEGRQKIARSLAQRVAVMSQLTSSTDLPPDAQGDVGVAEQNRVLPPPASPPHSFWDTGLTMRMAILVFCLVIFFAVLLWSNAPTIGVGVLLLLSIVQALRHLWIARTVWRNHEEPEMRWWRTGYAAMWAGLAGWFIFVLSTLPAFAAPPASSFASLWSMAWFIYGSIVLVAFGALDGIFLLSRVASPPWPWHMVARYAHDTWEQRWVMLFVGWMLLLVLFVSALGIEGFGIADERVF